MLTVLLIIVILNLFVSNPHILLNTVSSLGSFTLFVHSSVNNRQLITYVTVSAVLSTPFKIST